MWLILGGLILYFGLSAYIWGKFNESYFENKIGRSIIIRSAIILLGVILISTNVPTIFTAVSYAGWVVMGLLLMALAQTPIFWGQFSKLSDDDTDWLEIFYVTRIICTFVAIIMIGIGVGNGVPGWYDVPDPYADQRPKVEVGK